MVDDRDMEDESGSEKLMLRIEPFSINEWTEIASWFESNKVAYVDQLGSVDDVGIGEVAGTSREFFQFGTN